MNSFIFAFKQTIPVFFPYLFIGIAFGVLMKPAIPPAGRFYPAFLFTPGRCRLLWSRCLLLEHRWVLLR